MTVPGGEIKGRKSLTPGRAPLRHVARKRSEMLRVAPAHGQDYKSQVVSAGQRPAEWPVRLSVRTLGFQPRERGSTPLRATNNKGDRNIREDDKKFYDECSRILGIEHDYSEPPRRRTRWNTRNLGNGRFPGFGLVRAYGQMVMVTSRQGTRTFPKREEALRYLTDLKG